MTRRRLKPGMLEALVALFVIMGSLSVFSAFGQVDSTETFAARFSIAGSEHEAIAAQGDSGGAAFIRGENGWERLGTVDENTSGNTLHYANYKRKQKSG